MSLSSVNWGIPKRDTQSFRSNRNLNAFKTQKKVLFKGSTPDNAIMAWYSSLANNMNTSTDGTMKTKIIPDILTKLFEALPKAELHLHLSGSTPKSVIQDIMREEGNSEEEIQKETNFKTEFESLDDFLATYYKVAWSVKTPEHFKRSAYQICMDAAKENVKYLEIRTSCIGKEGDPDVILQAVSDGIKQAQKDLKDKGFDQTAKIIVLAQRHHEPMESLEHAKIAARWAQKPDSLVVGFDLAGPEASCPIVFHEPAIKYAKQAGLKITIHAGETNGSIYIPNEKNKHVFGDEVFKISAVDSIAKAVEYDTDRLGHAVHLYDNPQVAQLVKDRQIPIESPPRCNVQLNSVESYKDHPIKRMLDDGMLVSLSTDNRTISDTTITREFEELYNHKVITSWSDIKKLVINSAKSVFLPEQERQQLVKNFEKELSDIESKPDFKQAIDKYLTPALAFLGIKINKKSCDKAA